MSMIRLVSGLLIVFGTSNVAPLLLTVIIGSSSVDTNEIREPATVAKTLLVSPSNAHPAIEFLRQRLSEDDRLTLSPVQGTQGTNAPSSSSNEQISKVLTNLFNQALQDPGLRASGILQSTHTTAATRTLAARASTPMEQLRVNRQVLQEAFPSGLIATRHFIEVTTSVAFFVPFSLATVLLQLGFFWVLRQFLRDESMGWFDLLQGGCPSPQHAIPLGVCTGIMALVLMFPVSAASSWFWKQMHHVSHLQQPLMVLQQAQHPLQLAFFSVIAVGAAPFFEEIFFRGLLYSTLRQRGWGWAAAVVSAAVFGAIHFDLEKFLPLAFLGWIFAKLYESTGTLMAPILAHATFNTANLVLFLYLPTFLEGASR